MSVADRSRVQRAFNERAGVLLATDAASEGLNLHHRCRVVVHYELPWSPLRLEQRAGRVDRLGQRKAVHELALVASHTAERVVLAPLARRAEAARHSPAGSTRLAESLAESALSRAILDDDGESMLDPQGPQRPHGARPSADSCPSHSTTGQFIERVSDGLSTEACIEAARLEACRAIPEGSADASDRRRSRPVVTWLRTSSDVLRAGAVLVYLLALHDRDGQVVDCDVICVRMPWRIDRPCRAASDAVAAVAGSRGLIENARERLQPIVSGRLEHVGCLHARLIDLWVQRERLIGAQTDSEARRLVQSSLFDRRAVREHEARRQAARSLLEETAARIDALERSRSLHADVDLRAVLLVQRR
jgi:hypothetical protein